jgi:hypothetical protein
MRELATLQDFEERHGPADDRVDALLTDAASLILNEVAGSEAEWVTDSSVDAPAVVVAICVEVAFRAWSNPDALSSQSLGAHTQAWADRSGEALRLTKEEKRTVRRAAGCSSLRAVTLKSPYSGDESGSNIFENDLPL